MSDHLDDAREAVRRSDRMQSESVMSLGSAVPHAAVTPLRDALRALIQHAENEDTRPAKTNARALLAQLDERGIIAPGIEAEGILSLLEILERMESEGWRFLPPGPPA